MTETYTPQQHQLLIDEAKKAVEHKDPITRINRLLYEQFDHLDDANREFVIDEFFTWFDAFRGGKK